MKSNPEKLGSEDVSHGIDEVLNNDLSDKRVILIAVNFDPIGG